MELELLLVIVKLVSETTLHRGDSFLGLVLEFLGDHFGVVLNLLAQSFRLALRCLGELGFFSGEEFRFVLDRFLEGLDGPALFLVGRARGVAVRST